MKKLLLTAAFALMAFAAFAQDAPSAIQWKVGDDISADVNFGNLSFENPTTKETEDGPELMDFWSFTSSKGSTTMTGGLFECYDGADCDLFQLIQLPAGMYELNCQGYYRFGTSWDADPKSWADGTWENLSKLYAVAGTYDITSNEFTESGNTFSNPLMPRLFEEVFEQIYVGPKSGEEGYPGWDMSDGQYNDDVGLDGRWGPCSVPGSKAWFDLQKYLPFESDEDETVYNKVTFYVTEATWVKLGVSKKDVKSADTFFATNFHLIYKGDADEAAKIDMAYKTMEMVQRKVEILADEIIIEYPALGALLQDAMMELNIDDSSVEGLEAATAAFNKLHSAYIVYYEDAKTLSSTIETMDGLANSTDYDGKAAFEQAIEAARAIVDAEDPTLISGPEAYGAATVALTEARGAYILTRPAVDGVYNYSDMINQPFFCNNEYNPTWNEDVQQYLFSDEIESTWATVGEKSYNETLGEHADWIPICSNVSIASNGSDEGRWVIKSTTWHNGAVTVTMQHGYPAIGGWTENPTGNPELLHQTITSLPNGYYSMSALMCNVQKISDLQFVYIENSDGVQAKANLTMGAQGWWGGWTRNSTYEKLETDMIQVTDGKVTIGSSSDSFYAVTGFQLYYYGETPDFTAILKKKLASVSEKAETLTFAGDIAYVEGLLSAIPESIVGFEEYDAAKAALTEAEDYIQKATSATNNNTLGRDYDALFDKYNNPDAEGYIDGPVQSAILEKPMDFVALLGTNQNDVYTDIATAKDIYNAYKAYLEAYDQASVYDNAELKSLMEKQATALKAAYSNVETLNIYATELNFFVKRESIIAAGGKNASESNPVEVTSFIVNPDFTYSPTNGWSGNRATSNEYGRGNAEIWNTNPIDMYQVIKGLPAGKYEIRVRALYRDHGSVTDEDNESWTSYWTVANGDVDAWERHFAELYASTTDNGEEVESAAYIKSVCDGKFTEPSFTKYYRNNNNDLLEGDLIVDPVTGEETVAIDTVWTTAITAEQEAELLDEDGNVLESKDGYNLKKDGSRYVFSDDNGTVKFAYQLENTYPFDTRVDVEEGTFYYPSSMVGAFTRFNLSPEAYCNSVQIEVPAAGSDLRIGFRKDTKVDGDWIIFDDFQLFYLGGDLDAKPDYSAINEVVLNKGQKGIFNLAGQQMKNLMKGLNIVDGKKIFVK